MMDRETEWYLEREKLKNDLDREYGRVPQTYPALDIFIFSLFIVGILVAIFIECLKKG